MRLLLALGIMSTIGCAGGPTSPAPSSPDLDFVGEWQSEVDSMATPDIRIAFRPNGEISWTGSSTEPLTFRYVPETFDDWFKKRSHNINSTRDEFYDFVGQPSTVIVLYHSSAPSKPWGSLFYFPEKDLITFNLSVKFKRVK